MDRHLPSLDHGLRSGWHNPRNEQRLNSDIQKEGGAKMIGQNVFDHHEELPRRQILNVVNQKKHVIYTTEKGGLKKLVSIAPWYKGGEYAGFALIVLALPKKIPNIMKNPPLKK